METPKLIKIFVAYATLNEQVVVSLELLESCTIEEAIKQSGLLQRFPEIDINKQDVGIYSQIKSLNKIVADGDRIEIYRPLTIDPKEARRLKASNTFPPHRL